jgi:hypothetical protein
MDGAGVGNGSAAKRWDPVEQAQHTTLQTPKEILNGEIDQIVSARLASVRSQVEAWLNQPKVYQELSSRNHPTEDRPLTEREFQTKVQGALAAKIAEITAAETSPILRDPSGMIARAGFADHLDPVHLEGVCMQRFREGISATVGDVYKERQEAQINAALEEKDEFFKKISSIPGGKLTPEQVDEWIRLAAKDLSKNERQRLVDTGLVDLEDTTNAPRTTQATFRNLRNISNLSWAPTLALSTWAIWSLSTCSALNSSIVTSAATAAVVSLVNYTVQGYLSLEFGNIIKNTWKEAKTELGVVDVVRGVAWAGVMYKLISQHSPLYLAPDQTDLMNSGRPSSVAALLDHLKLAACVGVDSQMNKEGDRYYKGVNFKDKVVLAEEGLKQLEARWNFGWHYSKHIARVVFVVSSLAALASWSNLYNPLPY